MTKGSVVQPLKDSALVSNRGAESEIEFRSSFHTKTLAFVGVSYADKPRHRRIALHDADSREARERMKRDAEIGLVYVVWSYGNPIAWVNADGEACVVRTWVSSGVTRHQNVVGRLLGA